MTCVALSATPASRPRHVDDRQREREGQVRKPEVEKRDAAWRQEDPAGLVRIRTGVSSETLHCSAHDGLSARPPLILERFPHHRRPERCSECCSVHLQVDLFRSG